MWTDAANTSYIFRDAKRSQSIERDSRLTSLISQWRLNSIRGKSCIKNINCIVIIIINASFHLEAPRCSAETLLSFGGNTLMLNQSSPTFFNGPVLKGRGAVAVLLIVEPLSLILDAVSSLADAVARSLVILPFTGVRLHDADVTLAASSHVILDRQSTVNSSSSSSSSSSLARRRRPGPLRRSSMTAPDSVSPYIGWRALAVVTDLVQPAFRRTTKTTFPQSVWETAEKQVSLSA